MCAANNLPSKTSTTSTKPSTSTTKEPKWLTMKKQNKSSAGKTAKPIAPKSSESSAQKPQQETRNAKRARWAKKSKPVAKAPVNRGPVREYISVCCNVGATKPRAGAKEAAKDPETGKVKDKSKGLGHWRCTGCRKACKVKSQAPAPKSVVIASVPLFVPNQSVEVTVATT